jgi:hypothetical protein
MACAVVAWCRMGSGGPWGGSALGSSVLDQAFPQLTSLSGGHLKLSGDLERASLDSLAGMDGLRSAAGYGHAVSSRAKLKGLVAVAERVSHG